MTVSYADKLTLSEKKYQILVFRQILETTATKQPIIVNYYAYCPLLLLVL